MRIDNIQYVRNGSGGCDGFTQVFFSDGRKYKNMMAIAFHYPELPANEDRSKFAVIDLDDPTAKFDGEFFLPKILRAIAAWDSSWDASQAKYTIKFPFTVKP